MTTEHKSPISQEQINRAEKLRVRGRTVEASRITQAAVRFNADEFPSLAEKDKKLVLMGARIFVDSTISNARKSWKPNTVAGRLKEARTGIKKIYRDDDIRQELKNLKTDTEGNPYEFATEIARDEVKYTLTLAELTGNTQLLDQAINRLDQAIAHADESSAKELAIFEKNRILLSKDNSPENFDNLKTSYQAAVSAAEANKSWERVATIASWYSIAASTSAHPIESMKGFKKYADAALNDTNVVGIFPGEVRKKTIQAAKSKYWQKMSKEDYSSLKLPENGH